MIGTAERLKLPVAGRAQRIGLLVVTTGLVVLFGSLRSSFYNEQLVVFPLLRDVAILTVVAWPSSRCCPSAT